MRIQKIQSREILDSRGNPTLESEVFLSDGSSGIASVPSGMSTGAHEALELRDKDMGRYHGKGVLTAIKNVQGPILKKLQKMKFSHIREIDDAMILLDGTKNKQKLGANAILSVSLACARAVAQQKKMPLYRYLRKEFFQKISGWAMPYCMMNIINGGVHASWSSDVQEYMIIPGQKKVSDRVRCGSEIFHTLQENIRKAGFRPTVGDEGGFAISSKDNKTPLIFIMQAIRQSGYRPRRDVSIGLDVAASEFYRNGKYELKTIKKKKNSKEMIGMLASWIKKYPIISIEDPLFEDDWTGWSELTEKLGKKIIFIGDDLFVTDPDRLERGVESRAGNGILIKPNQIGTLSETANAISLAKKNNYRVAISHRSGETNDDYIADISVACSADFLKAGSLSRGERLAKYNRLMAIEKELS